MTNEAQTIWQPAPPVPIEYSNGTANSIVDPSGNNLVDPSSNQVVDTGVTGTQIDDTIWVESPGN